MGELTWVLHYVCLGLACFCVHITKKLILHWQLSREVELMRANIQNIQKEHGVTNQVRIKVLSKNKLTRGTSHIL